MTRMAPIPIEECPHGEPRATLEYFTASLDVVPNSMLTIPRVLAMGATC